MDDADYPHDDRTGLLRSPDAILFRLDVVDEICRVCLNSGTFPIFGGDDSEDLSEELKYFACVDISPDDSLPQNLCSQCRDALESAVTFKSLAQNSDNVLRKRNEEDCEIQGSQSASVGKAEEQNREKTGESSDEDLENGVYLEYAETVNSESATSDNEESNIGFNDVSTIPESVELQPAEIETLVKCFNKNAQFLQCEVCEITFKTTEQVNEHRASHHPAHIATCEVCKNIIHRDKYSIHLQLHRESYNRRIEKKNKKVECTECGKFISKSYLKRHTEMHSTDEKRFKKCTMCDKHIRVLYLSDHIKRKHTQHKPTEEKSILKLKCPVCSRIFKDSTYESHVASHALSRKKYVCEECGRECSSPSSFATHILTHKEEYKYKCQFCPYRGKHLALLKIHVRTHTKDYLYKCTTCAASFSTKSNLSAHERTHIPGAKFVCSDCGKSFAAERTMKNHIVSVHQQIKAYPCDLCGKSYGHKDVMMAHKKRIHQVAPIRPVGRKPSYLLRTQENNEVDDV